MKAHFIKCSCATHFNAETPLSLNVYHQFANELIKQHEIHNCVVKTNPAKAFPIAIYSLLITAQRGFLWLGNVRCLFRDAKQPCFVVLWQLSFLFKRWSHRKIFWLLVC